jgi:oxygen-independent coproporphyrinogen-3 oxidase
MSDYTHAVGELREKFAGKVAADDLAPYVYTYPPKGAYRPFADGRKAAESWRSVQGPINLYAHVPFCDMKCSFCNLFATTHHSEDTLNRYVAAICREFDLATAAFDLEQVELDSIYFGGGTPSVLSDRQLTALTKKFSSRSRIASDVDVSIEAAPDSIDAARCEAFLKMGFTRLSIGIQSFDDQELRAMGRHYGADRGAQVASAAVGAGIPNVNLDLIYGLPGQTAERWRRSLDIAVAIGPQTLTIYPLVVRNRTTFGTLLRMSTIQFPAAQVRYEWYDLAVELLTASGYRQRTLVTFARDRGGCRQEANEFIGLPTLGLGAGARSYAPRLHYANDDYRTATGTSAAIAAYLVSVESGVLPVRSAVGLDETEAARRYMILNLLYQGVDRQRYQDRFGETVEQRFGIELDVLRAEGCLDESSPCLSLSARGRRLANLVADLLASSQVRDISVAYA